MSYIGNEPSIQAFVTDQFSGNGSTTVFTMSVAPATATSVLIAVSGVLQDPSTYSVVGTTLTFSSAPPAGTGNISARYLGIPASNIVTTAYRTVTEFTATASQTTFIPPSYTPGFINVYRNGSLLGSADYTAVNGTTVILAVGATVGDLVTVESLYVSSVVNAIPATVGSVGSTYLANGAATQAFLDIASGTGTGALRLPVGTTAQRPSGTTGLIRQNSTTGNPEWWDATTSSWLQFSQPAGYTVNYLVVAGGGGGSGTAGAGGGAGGVLAASTTLSGGVVYTITVGAGGAGGPAAITTNTGTSGSSSSISAVATSIGGGGGGSTYTGYSTNGLSGGSGGGGGGLSTSAPTSGGSGTAGQGFAGGNASSTATGYGSGGGGGASAVGTAGTSSTVGNGGNGVLSSISGTPITYAGGGGAGTYVNYIAVAGTGGTGGGGNGSATSGVVGQAGTVNLGGGGGGGSYNGTGPVYTAGGAGGSGIVIIAYLGSQRGTGGTITSSGGYTIHTFTSSGTYNA